MKTIIKTSQRANTDKHGLIKTSLYNASQYTPVLVVNTNPHIQHIVQSIPILNILNLYILFILSSALL